MSIAIENTLTARAFTTVFGRYPTLWAPTFNELLVLIQCHGLPPPARATRTRSPFGLRFGTPLTKIGARKCLQPLRSLDEIIHGMAAHLAIPSCPKQR